MRLLLLLSFFILSCSGEEAPKGVFTQEKMSAVLYDIILADEWVDFSRMSDSAYLNFSKRAAIYDSIFQLHTIEKEDYVASISYYQSRPDLLKEVLESLKTKADTTSVKKIKPVPAKKL